MMKYNPSLPSVADMAVRARKRIPRFAMDYLESGIGEEYCLRRNRSDLDEIVLCPRYLRDVSSVDTRCELFDHVYDLGIGISPVGLGNMMWPDAEKYLATAAQQANIPYIYSTMGTTPLESVAALAPDVAWFQLYVPREAAIRKDLVGRISSAGFNALVITADIPVGAKRDRELKNGLILPFKITPRLLGQVLVRPGWAMQTLRHGIPQFVNLLPYGDINRFNHLGEFLTQFFVPGVTPEHIRDIRKLWQGPLIVKGLLHASDIKQCIDLGVDGVIVSNHAGRQLDAAPSSIHALQQLPDDLHKQLKIMLDSGIRSGLDVVRAKAVGARAAFSGRSFIYAVAAAGSDGGRQVIEIFRDEITRTLQQLGCDSFRSLNAEWLGNTGNHSARDKPAY
ncbi:MAG: alpha-hydroxy acid oxidase [Gammaproteobacteria bacterium]|nr:alpha-hydroxy acid oxidase [Gammaproteobacteria bacterium]